MCERRRLFIAGIGMGNFGTMTDRVKDVIQKSECLIGAGRILTAVRKYSGDNKEYFCEYDPAAILSFLNSRSHYSTVAVLMSGDTGFYSGSKGLVRQLKTELADWEIIIEPGISSIAYFASRLQVSWEDADLISLHGKKKNFVRQLAENRKTFILLGGKDAAGQFFEGIREFELKDLIVHIGRNLSYPEEKIISKRAEQLLAEDLEGLCTVLAENPDPERTAVPHVRDSEFIRNSTPMTKEEVRAVSIARLELTKDAVIYDIGAGTGSVSVEIALSGRDIRVYAIEKNKAAMEVLTANRRKFYADGIVPIEGCAPEALEQLEPPSHVFIGGSSGNLREILRSVLKKNPKARIVINAASLETMSEIFQAEKEGLLKNPDIILIQTSRYRVLGNYHMPEGMNPVYIISSGGGGRI